ncbi:hypothetical protein BGZ65_005004 [Modicella reniformis]|uniref:Small ribosomal subunit protein mS38 n=1 Tax=Modicella reniformis TaxID=1440133 RepID=A0A9P6LU67_9FUNG|nr:hypothetical protein BGZ65_005004 [Modicella reniformis]
MRASFRHQTVLRSVIPTAAITPIRYQSSSSSRRDNENQDNTDVDPVKSKETPVNASFELHQVDLAHGSFFAMHRPLLGITNGPMFANTSTSNDMGDNTSHNQNTTNPIDDLSIYFSSLHPYTQETSMYQIGPISATAVAWASYPPSLPDPDQAVSEFFDMAETKLEEESNDPDSSNLNALRNALSMSEPTISSDPVSLAKTALSAIDPQLSSVSPMHLTSVLRKRRIKMKKHKYKKLRKRTRALRKKLGK